MHRLTRALLLPLALAFAACGGNTSGNDPGSGGSGGNGGNAGSGGGSCAGVDCKDGNQCCNGQCISLDLVCEGEPCGDTVCTGNTYCCNASCGTCVAPGEGCTAIACGTGGSGGGGGGGGQAGGGGAGGATFQCGFETCQSGQQCCGIECGGGFCADGELPCPPVDCQPVLCGQTYCEGGTYCCNDSCSTCAKPGEGCTNELCEPDCSAQRAEGYGDCDGFFGWAWTGTYCTAIGGCSCNGPDCDSLYYAEEDCWKAYGMCPIPL